MWVDGWRDYTTYLGISVYFTGRGKQHTGLRGVRERSERNGYIVSSGDDILISDTDHVWPTPSSLLISISLTSLTYPPQARMLLASTSEVYGDPEVGIVPPSIHPHFFLFLISTL